MASTTLDPRVHKLAVEIRDMILMLEGGALKRTARDYISGLVAAYGILTDEPDAAKACDAAKAEAAR